MVADTPPSRAGSLLQLDWVHLRNIDRLAGRLRWQASSHNWIGCICEILVGWQAAFAGRPAPTIGLGVSAKCWSAVRPPSRAGQLPQWNVGTCKRLVGCQAAFAGKPRSYKGSVYTLRSSPLIRPSVSSPAFDLDLPAPSGGRVEAFIWGVGAQRRAAKPHTSRGGRSEADRRRCPQMNAGARERRA